LGIPGFFIALYGFVGIVTGGKLVGGALGALWGYLAVAGAYELNRRKFDWERGKKYSDQHLMAGSAAVAFGLMISGALHETMPALAIIPALSAILQANDGHEKKYFSIIHAATLIVGIGVGILFYTGSGFGQVLIQRVESLP